MPVLVPWQRRVARDPLPRQAEAAGLDLPASTPSCLLGRKQPVSILGRGTCTTSQSQNPFSLAKKPHGDLYPHDDLSVPQGKDLQGYSRVQTLQASQKSNLIFFLPNHKLYIALHTIVNLGGLGQAWPIVSGPPTCLQPEVCL